GQGVAVGAGPRAGLVPRLAEEEQLWLAAALGARSDEHVAAAEPAAEEPGQQMPGDQPRLWASIELAIVLPVAAVCLSRPVHAIMGRLPQLLADDTQLGLLQHDPFRLRPLHLRLAPGTILRLAVDHAAPVQLAVQHLAQRGGAPVAPVRRTDAICVQC